MTCSLVWCSDSILHASRRARSPSSYFWDESYKAEQLGRLGTGILTALGQGSFVHPFIPLQDRIRIEEGCEALALLPAHVQL